MWCSRGHQFFTTVLGSRDGSVLLLGLTVKEEGPSGSQMMYMRLGDGEERGGEFQKSVKALCTLQCIWQSHHTQPQASRLHRS